MKKLFSYTIAEFFTVFNPVFFGFLTLSLVIKFGKIYETGGFNLPFKELLHTIALLLPTISIIIIPIAFLVSLSVTTTKLCSTSEITALQTSGISVLRIFRVYFYIAMVIFVFYLLVTTLVKPITTKTLRLMLAQIAMGQMKIEPQEKLFTKISTDLYIYCEKSQSTLENVLLFQREDNGNSTIIFSQKADFGKEKDLSFNFYNGNLFKLENNSDTYFMDFENLYYNPFSNKDNVEMNLSKGSISTAMLLNKIKEGSLENSEKTELVNRFCAPLSIFIFLFLAFPFSLSHSRNYKTTGITISIAIGLIYFLTTSFVNTFSQKGFFNPIIAIAGTNVILLFLSILVFYRKVWGKV